LLIFDHCRLSWVPRKQDICVLHDTWHSQEAMWMQGHWWNCRGAATPCICWLVCIMVNQVLCSFLLFFRLQVAYLFILLGFKLLICWLVCRMLDKKDNQLFQETTTNVPSTSTLSQHSLHLDYSHTENHQQHC
jgi:Flp pilus assembly protein TadB